MPKKNILHSKITVFFVALFTLWVGISIVRLIYNVARVFTEEKNWLIYSEEQKKEVLYGDMYDVIKYINVHYPLASSQLIIADDGKAYFVARYILYPRLIYWDKLESNILENSDNYSLIINFHPDKTNTRYNDSFFKSISKNRRIVEIRKQKKIIALIYI